MEKIFNYFFSVKRTKTDFIVFTRMGGIINLTILMALVVILGFTVSLNGSSSLPTFMNIFLFIVSCIGIIVNILVLYFMLASFKSKDFSLFEVATRLKNKGSKKSKTFLDFVLMEMLDGQFTMFCYKTMDFPFYDRKTEVISQIDKSHKAIVDESEKKFIETILSTESLKNKTLMDLYELNLNDHELDLIKKCRVS